MKKGLYGVLIFALGTALVAGCGGSGDEASDETALVARKAKIAEAKKAQADKLAKRRADRVRQQQELRAKKREALGADFSEAAWLKERARMVKDIMDLVRDVEEEDEANWQNPRWLTKPQALRKILDLGDHAAALSMARRMRHSSRAADRAAALDAFGWIGEQAMSDLTVMLADKNPEIAAEALSDWQSSLAEIEDESLKGEFILEAARLVANDEDMSSIMMELTTFESPKEAVKTLDAVITDGQTTAAAKSEARETFEFVTREAYSDSARAATLGTELENDLTKVDADALRWAYERQGKELTQDVLDAIKAAEAAEGGAK